MKAWIRRHLVPLLLGLLAAVVLIGVAIAVFVRQNAPRKVAGLDNPYVVFNFNPERMKELGDADWSQSMYRYDLSGGTVQEVLPDNGIYYSDLDSDTGMLIGREGDQVVETSMAESGALVLYRQEPGRFEVLADMSNVWNGYCFGGSWVDDGETLSVPDETGIALLDIASKKLEHWVTLPITYSTSDILDPLDNRSAFEVSNHKKLVVYCENNELKEVVVDEFGKLVETITLEDWARGDCSFAIAPDGESVIFVIERFKRVLFTPKYYDIRICQNGVTTTLVETSPLPNQCMTVFW